MPRKTKRLHDKTCFLAGSVLDNPTNMPKAFYIEVEGSRLGVLCPISQLNWFGSPSVSGLMKTDARYNLGLQG